MKKLKNYCVAKYSLFNISSKIELCAIMRKLWNSLQNNLNNIYKREAHFFCNKMAEQEVM